MDKIQYFGMFAVFVTITFLIITLLPVGDSNDLLVTVEVENSPKLLDENVQITQIKTEYVPHTMINLHAIDIASFVRSGELKVVGIAGNKKVNEDFGRIFATGRETKTFRIENLDKNVDELRVALYEDGELKDKKIKEI